MPNFVSTTARPTRTATSNQTRKDDPATKESQPARFPVGHPNYQRPSLGALSQIPTRSPGPSMPSFSPSLPKALNSKAVADFKAHRLGRDNLHRFTTAAILRAQSLQEGKGCIAALEEAGIKPASECFNALLRKHFSVPMSDEQRHASIEHVLTTMKNKNVPRNVVTYNILVSGYANSGEADRAKQAFEQIEKEGMQPDALSFTRLMLVYARKGRATEAKEVFDAMGEKFDHDERAFTTLISAYSHAGQVADAKQTFEAMMSKGVPPTILTYESLMAGYAKLGKAAEAKAVFDLIPPELKPNTICFNTLISAYVKAGEFANLWPAVTEMDRLGVQPDAVTYTTVISAFANEGLWDRVDALIQSAVDCNIFKADLGLRRDGSLDFHENSIFTAPPRQPGHVPGVPTEVAKALFRHHLRQGHISAQTEFVVGSHGANKVKDAIFELMRGQGMQPREWAARNRSINPGILVCGNRYWQAPNFEIQPANDKSLRASNDGSGLDPKATAFSLR